MIMKNNGFIFLLALSLPLLFFTSCKNVNSNILFKIPKDGSFQFDSITINPKEDYRIGPGDRISFLFSPNKGEQLIFNQSGVQEIREGGIGQSRNRMDFLVRSDGLVEFPLIGNFYINGYTIRQAEDSLRVLLSKDFVDPFVMIRVTNQRVVVFPGKGTARLVPIENNNTTLLEVIALSGGIAEQGRSNSIRVMRRTEMGKREIFNIDLSTIEGIREADMVVQANDYIYVDFKPRIANSVLSEVRPWISLVSTTFASYLLLMRFL